jgi:hypothetical protein
MRLMYWYAVAPVVVLVGTLVFLTIPYLALAVLAILVFLALAALVRAIVLLPYRLWWRHQSRVG